MNDNDQTPLNQFAVYMLYNQVCNRHCDKSNRWSLGLCLSMRRVWPQAPYLRYTAVHRARQLAEWRGEYVSNSTAVRTKNGSREQNHAHFKGNLSSFWTFVVRRLGLATVNLYTKYEISMFTHYEDMKGDEECKNWGGLGG